MKVVLVVEDNSQLGKMLTTTLVAAGFDASWVATGAEAVVAAKQRSPEVILIDLHLADMTGVELADTLRDRQQMARLVAVSGDVPVKATTAKFDSFLLKPVSLQTLLRAVDA